MWMECVHRHVVEPFSGYRSVNMNWMYAMTLSLDISTLTVELPKVLNSNANLPEIDKCLKNKKIENIIAGYRNVGSRDTSLYNFQSYIFQNKFDIRWYDMNGMYSVTCGDQFSLDIVTLIVDFSL